MESEPARPISEKEGTPSMGLLRTMTIGLAPIGTGFKSVKYLHRRGLASKSRIGLGR
jgi:hypothetical protein